MRLPKYEILRQYIIDIAGKHENHEKPILSEREMSRKFNVTRTSLRRALKELIDEGMLIPRQGSGLYLTGTSFRNSAVRQLALPKIVVLSAKGRSGFFDNWYMYIYSAILREFSKYPVTLFPCFLVSEKEDMLQEIEMYNPDGIVWIQPDKNRNKLLAELEKKYPVCQFLGTAQGCPLSVTVDYCKAGENAAEYFYEQGCRAPVYVGANEKEYPLPAIDLFFTGWKNAWKRLTGKFDRGNVAKQNDDLRHYFNSGTLKKADCIFCHSNIFYGFAQDIAGTPFEQCPVMVDSPFYIPPPDSKIKPSAEIELYSDGIFTVAAEKMIMKLKNPEKAMVETLLVPGIKRY